MDAAPNTIRVKLTKRRETGLGFLVKQRKSKPYVIISDITSGGIAEESGLVQIGDTVLRINDIEVTEMCYENAVEILKAVPTEAPVVLLLRGPEGYTTHLQTIFLENGAPRTVRVTEPVSMNSSPVGRFRRSRTRSPSPLCSSPSSPRSVCNGDCSPARSLRNRFVWQPDGGSSKSRYGADNPGADGDSHDISVQVDIDSDVKVNSKVSDARKRCDETLLNDGQEGSPKIVLTSVPRALNDGGVVTTEKNVHSKPDSNHGRKRSIEIRQDSDEITVIVKGDIKIKSDQEGKEKGCMEYSPEKPTSEKSVTESIVYSNGLKGNDYKASAVDGGEEDVRKTRPERRQSLALQSPNMQRRLSERRGSSASPKRFLKLRNVADEKILVDTLHTKAIEQVPCSSDKCLGSIMAHQLKRPPGVPRCKDDLIVHAKDFIDQYYASIKRSNTAAHQKRVQEVMNSIETRGTYDLTYNELTFGAKTAWRNAPRCIGRIQWSKLQVFDARHITTARGMFEAICNHIKYGTNRGNIRSAITIFPARTDGKHDYRVWNAQLIRYAGYKQPDGSIIGDPSNLEFTEICQKMGWKGNGGMFDILPLVLSANGHDPEMFEIPRDLILEAQIKHPKYPWFAELGLRWYCLPAVSGMLFDCGGLEFTACPFNGWYMGTEIGARDLCDVHRYNMLEKVAEKMGLDIRKSSSLWKDRVLVEMNIAVLYSFQQNNVTITDHHAASESFMKHIENEQRLRGGCPADWVWVVPPMSGSILPVFHQEMLNYNMKPSYEYQEDPWKSHVWKKDRGKGKSVDRPKRKFGFRELARAVKFSAKLMGKALARRVKCTILYATETGKSERYSKTLCEIFRHAFDARVVCMDEYDVIDLEHEALVLVVTSTFGNGDPPENGERFAKALYSMKHPGGGADGEFRSTSYIRMSASSEPESTSTRASASDDNLTIETGALGNVRYSVFGLGSRAYPNFCAFGHYMDNIMARLGGERIHAMMEGDELCGQEQSFNTWAQEAFKAACETFCVGDDINMKEVTGALSKSDFSWSPGKFRLTPVDSEREPSLCVGLSKLHNKMILPSHLTFRCNLQAAESSRQTILLKLDSLGASELVYQPGDHVGIFPANQKNLVDAILSRLSNAPPSDELVKIEVLQERSTPLGSTKQWSPIEKFPSCTMRSAFTYYLDISTPPTPMMLKMLATQATQEADVNELERLSTNPQAYEDWKRDFYPNIAEVLELFPSLKVSPTLLITQLPLLQQRFYSISSSPQAFPGEIHATIAVVQWRTQGGAGPLHRGVCSNWLNTCDIGETVPCLVRAAPSFYLPEDSTVPAIMVGPGTGIAPFRSFWQQRKIDMDMLPVPEQDGNKRGWGEMALYFGCRQANIDEIYKDEVLQAKADGVISKYFIALSREPGLSKTYVQDILMKNSEEVYRSIVQDGGHFYVCGDVSMASDVCNTLEKILQNYGSMSPETAKNYVLKLRDANRFHEDIFGVTLRTSEVNGRGRDQKGLSKKYIEGEKESKSSNMKDSIDDNKSAFD
ncbi:nitric oxide synthase 1-like [Liolophura sinensis]|uniref:nitric oxide synthase 1-like n=1 Tax=Liolophura sinensis TaxID=3198878 RepID=UPI003158350C